MSLSTNWYYFRLLIWKNWIIQKQQKIQFASFLILPIFFILLLTFLRILLPDVIGDAISYPPIGVGNLSATYRAMLEERPLHNLKYKVPLRKVVYSPYNAIYDKIIAKAVQDLDFEGYRAFRNSEILEHVLRTDSYFVGVEFPDNTANIKKYPTRFAFALRFPSELRTSKSKRLKTWLTNALFRPQNFPRNPNNPDGGIPPGYIIEGFIAIQNAITIAYLELATNRQEPLPVIKVRRMSYGTYEKDLIFTEMQIILPLFLIFIYLYPSIYIIKLITREKEQLVTQIITIMGIQNWIIWFSWFTTSFVLLSFVGVFVTLMFKLSVSTYQVSKTEWSIIFVFLLFYSMVQSAFLLMVSSLFCRSGSAALTVGILCFATNLPFLIPSLDYNHIEALHTKLIGCLLTNTALDYGFRVMLFSDNSAAGVNWHNVWDKITIYENLRLWHVCGMMIIATIIYIIIGWYFNLVIPVKYGMTRKWYFPLKYLFSCKFFGRRENRSLLEMQQSHISSVIQPETNGNVGLKLTNIEIKDQKKQLIVHQLSLDLYMNEVTVMVGHNGSGKTAILLMLAGLIKPSNGNVFDTRINRDVTGKVLRSIGICPQENVIFDEMSIRDHITFFCYAKGKRTKQDVEREVHKYLNVLKLPVGKEYVAASQLSAGLKRALAVCCALCGDAKHVICDEPALGMDVLSKGRIWDLLNREKKGRIILVATHSMKDGDLLADRIAVMCHGHLQCYGTPIFVKQRFGDGYRLIIVRKDGCDVHKVSEFLSHYVPSARVEEFLSHPFTYYIPKEELGSCIQMLIDLEAKADELKIKIGGIYSSTFREAFMQINAEHILKKHSDFLRVTLSPKFDSSIFGNDLKEREERKLFLLKILSLLYKKAFLTYRNISFVTVQVLLPVIFLSVVIYHIRNVADHKALPPLVLDLAKYDETILLMEISNDIKPNSLEDLIANEYEDYANDQKNVIEIIRSSDEFDKHTLLLQEFWWHYVAGAIIKPNELTALMNNEALHAAGQSVALLHNAMARSLLGTDASIEVTNKPLPYAKASINKRIGEDFRKSGIEVSLCFCTSFMSAYYGMMTIRERESRARLLQYVCGASRCMYWLVTYAWDYAVFVFSVCGIIISMAFINHFVTSPVEGLLKNMVVLLIFGLVVLPRTYFISLMFHDQTTGFASILIYNFLSGIGLYVIMNTYFIIKGEKMPLVMWMFGIFPTFFLIFGLRYGDEEEENVKFKLMDTFPKYEMAFVLIMNFILAFLILLIFVGPTQLINKKIMQILTHMIPWCKNRKKFRTSGGYVKSLDVKLEESRIEALTKEQIAEYPAVAIKLYKHYGDEMALNGVSFRVNQGDTFLLFGRNGAGKTTLLKLLAGDGKPNDGQIYVKGYDFNSNRQRSYQIISYCPQEDALFNELTGRETLIMHGMLRGLRIINLRSVIESLAYILDFTKVLDAHIGTYTLQYKRKISVALSVIGNPSLLYLDEPTYCLDHINRLRVWHLLKGMISIGKTIVLSTNSIYECEAMGTHVGILVYGDFRAIGTMEHVSEKYCRGITLHISLDRHSNKERKPWAEYQQANYRDTELSTHLYVLNSREVLTTYENAQQQQQSTESEEDIYNVSEFVAAFFPNSTLINQYRHSLTFYIPKEDDINCTDIFTVVERNRNKLDIEDYEIVDCDVENVILAYAKLAQLERPSGVLLKKRWPKTFCCCKKRAPTEN